MKSLFFAFLLPLSLAVSPRAFAAKAAHAHGDKEPVVGVSSLDVWAAGNTLHLLTATQQPGKAPQLRWQQSGDGGATWSMASSVGDGQPPTIAKRGMDAQIAAAGERIVAVWPTAGTDKMGRGPMASAVSSDGGKTWRAGPNPADDGLTIGHSFIDLAVDASGAFHLVWLDSRDGDAKGLRYARSTDGGVTWSANQTLDGDTCECCWNALTSAPDGRIAVLYRRKNPRDMAVVISADAGKTWGEPVTVGAFGWEISACPHVGGAVAFGSGIDSGSAAHAAVWTAKDGATHGVYVLNSSDRGATWSDPHRVGPAEASRPDLAIGPSGALTLVYDAYVHGVQGVFVAASSDSGKSWSAPRRLSTSNASATHGRLVATPTGVRAFWTERQPGRPLVWLSGVP